MSQVLIGIIGVILFIGLALAGALFLGEQFQNAQSASKAAAATQVVTQVAQAANLYMLDEGGNPPPPTSAQVLVDSGHLKEMPVNPISPTHPPQLWEMSGGPNHVDMVVMHAGALTSDRARETCDAINKQSTGYDGPTPTDDPTMDTEGVSGCWRASFGAYYVWAKI